MLSLSPFTNQWKESNCEYILIDFLDYDSVHYGSSVNETILVLLSSINQNSSSSRRKIVHITIS
jgi:hypothetical protein